MNKPVLLLIGIFLLSSSQIDSYAQARLTVNSGISDGASHPTGVSQTAGKVSERRVTLHVRDTTLKYVLLELARRASLKIIYDNTDPIVQKRVSLSADSIPVLSAFSRALSGTGLTSALSPDNNTVIVSRVDTGSVKPDSGKGNISGMVVDSSTGTAVAGASVVLSGPNRSTVTELTGRGGSFIFRGIAPGSYDLTIRSLGFSSKQVRVSVAAEEPVSIRIQLATAAMALNEVVTTVTGEQRKLEMGNSIATINVDSVIAVAPVSNLTDVLENRVPGLTVQRAGGRPGDPARIRLRGASSINNSNDVIVVVDGVRIESGLSEFGAHSEYKNSNDGAPIMAASPIDQIDINSIEKIDVFKGPSAAAMYGSDAANGVIVITTKKGQSGPSRWTASLEQGVSYVPGRFPERVYRYGSMSGLTPTTCADFNPLYSCVVDSIVRYQALDDPFFNILSNGSAQAATVSVSGGVNSIQFYTTLSHSQDIGVVKMSPFLKKNFTDKYERHVPSKMNRPDKFNSLSFSNKFVYNINNDLEVDLTSRIYRDIQQRSSLGSRGVYHFSTYFGPDSRNLVEMDDLSEALAPALQVFNESSKRNSDRLSTSGSFGYTKMSWLPIRGTIGIDRVLNNDKTQIPRGISNGGPSDTTGKYALSKEVITRVDFNATSSIRTFSERLITTIGLNGLRTNRDLLNARLRSLPPGVSEPVSFSEMARSAYSVSSNGWFIEPRLNLNSNFFASPGLRIDQNGLQGNGAGLMGLPKINISWLASESDNIYTPSAISMLRLRLAMGSAGIQPGIQDRLRLYSSPDSVASHHMVSTIGNTLLRPERSTEYEFGFDLDLLEGRIGMELTHYNKIKKDAIISVRLAPSLATKYGDQPIIRANLGEIQNKGLELMLHGIIMESSNVSWGSQISFSSNSNRVNHINKDSYNFELIRGGTNGGFESRVVEGYPLWGIWARPLVGYADLNGDGDISPSEVRVADSSVYVGQSDPKGTVAISSYLSLFGGALSANINAGFVAGGSQVASLSRFAFESNANLENGSLLGSALRAATVGSAGHNYTAYGLIQRVNTWRVNSASIRYMVPAGIASKINSRSMSISLLGRNLFMRSSYMGVDPNVNTRIYQDGMTEDLGAIPPLRSWALKVQVGN